MSWKWKLPFLGRALFPLPEGKAGMWDWDCPGQDQQLDLLIPGIPSQDIP